jgi:hypothetical protein
MLRIIILPLLLDAGLLIVKADGMALYGYHWTAKSYKTK